mgnify:CR=1 FL=1
MYKKGAVKKRKFFCSSFLGDRKKRCRTDKLSKIKASDLILLARRRTRVRRVAKFVRSIKHNSFINFRFPVFLKGSIGLLNLQNPLLYLVLYGLRFFYIPFCYIGGYKLLSICSTFLNSACLKISTGLLFSTQSAK